MVEVDPTVCDLLCECLRCPPGLGVFTFRVLAEGSELAASYTCPRGHQLGAPDVRATAKVDDSGYTIDRRHPLWEI